MLVGCLVVIVACGFACLVCFVSCECGVVLLLVEDYLGFDCGISVSFCLLGFRCYRIVSLGGHAGFAVNLPAGWRFDC